MRSLQDRVKTRDDTGTIRMDMHVHSRHSSDASIPVLTIVQRWQETGILPLVCDHNTIQGSLKVYRLLREHTPDIPEILTEEIMTRDGEIIGMFLQDNIPAGMSADETLDCIRDQGAIAIVPHPFCVFRSSAIRTSVLDAIVDRIDIIEGFNGRAVDLQDNDRARSYAARHHKPISAGSDSHAPDELCTTYVDMPVFATPKELLCAIRSAEFHYRRITPVHEAVRLSGPGSWPRSGGSIHSRYLGLEAL